MDDLIQIIEEINKATDHSLSITYYSYFWNLSSYIDKSLFATGEDLKGTSLLELIKEAHSITKKNRILHRKFSLIRKNEILHRKYSLSTF